MEPLPKRLKPKSKDPALRFNRKCLELIFQHFTFHDKITTTTVSKKWNYRIGSSHQCMSKIKLQIYLEKISRIESSKRKYQHVRLVGDINFLDKKETNRMIKYLQNSSLFLDSLVIVDCHFDCAISFNTTKINFLHLKHLKLEHVNLEFTALISESAGDKVQHLEIQDVEVSETFKKFLLRCELLETLNIDLKTISALGSNLAAYKFRLKTLIISNHWRFVSVKSFVEEFLLVQKLNIESLSLTEMKVSKHQVALIINAMENLKTLHLGQILEDSTSSCEPIFRSNTSIMTTKLMTVPFSISWPIVKHCINIKTIQTNRISKSLVDITKERSIDLSYSSNYKVRRKYFMRRFNTSSVYHKRDPLLLLPQNCCDLILQHLNVKQLMRISMVSILWFNCVNDDEKLMSRVKFFYRDFCQTVKRNYRHMKLLVTSFNSVLNIFDQEFSDSIISLEMIIDGRNAFKLQASSKEFAGELLGLQRLAISADATFLESFLKDEKLSREIIESSEFYRFINNMQHIQEVELIQFNAEVMAVLLPIIKANKVVIKNLSNFARNEICFELSQQSNEFIDQLDLKLDQRAENAILQHFLSICINIKLLNVHTLTTSNLQFIICNCPKIERITFYTASDECLQIMKNSRIQFSTIKPELCIDPMLRIPNELHALIFQHLDSYESIDKTIIRSSEVSKTWFNFTKDSDIFIDAIEFHCDFGEISFEKLTRKYKTFNLVCDYETRSTVDESFQSFVNLMQNVSANLTELTIFLKFDVFEFSPESIKPPNMQHLKVESKRRLSLGKLVKFLRSENLKTFEVKNFILDPDDAEDFITFLSINKNLKELVLDKCEGLEHIFKSGIAQRIQFQLVQLLLPIYEHVSLLKIGHNINSFLLQQIKSLEYLDLIHVSGAMLNTVFAHSKLLQYFRFLKLSDSPAYDLFTETIHSLQYLKLPFMYRVDYIKPYIRCAPNLKELSIGGLSEEILDYVADHIPHLEEILYAEAHAIKKVDLEEIGATFRKYKGIKLWKSDYAISKSGNRLNKWIERKFKEKLQQTQMKVN